MLRFPRTLINQCEKFMLEFIATFEVENGRPARPSDFDIIIGHKASSAGFDAAVYGQSPAWNRTPFCTAMANLVADRSVIATNRGGIWEYTVPVAKR